MKLLDFLFGKKPNIFNKQGRVEHKLKDTSWSLWQQNYLQGKAYNWRKHSGTKYTSNSILK